MITPAPVLFTEAALLFPLIGQKYTASCVLEQTSWIVFVKSGHPDSLRDLLSIDSVLESSERFCRETERHKDTFYDTPVEEYRNSEMNISLVQICKREIVLKLLSVSAASVYAGECYQQTLSLFAIAVGGGQGHSPTISALSYLNITFLQLRVPFSCYDFTTCLRMFTCCCC